MINANWSDRGLGIVSVCLLNAWESNTFTPYCDLRSGAQVTRGLMKA
jgi:hypothetical protein